MRMFRGPSEKVPSINVAVQVEAYIEDQGVLCVKGKRLETGKDIVVGLTNRGDLVSNTKRPSLSDFRDKKNNCGVEIGGVIGFDQCYPNGTEGKYFARWPVFLAASGSNADMARVKVNRNATLAIRSSVPNGGRLFGTLSVWQTENVIELSSLEMLEAATKKWLNDVQTKIKNAHGAAIMRARNALGEVVAYTYLYSRKDKAVSESGDTTFKLETGDTTLENFKQSRAYEGFVKEATDGRAMKFDIVPAVNLDISPKALEDGANGLRMTEKSYQRDGDLIAKGTTFVMDPNHKFVTKVVVHDPYGDSGIDPVLFAKGGQQVTYNAAFKAALTGQAAPEDVRSAKTEAASAPAEEPALAY